VKLDLKFPEQSTMAELASTISGKYSLVRYIHKEIIPGCKLFFSGA
jgi:hypothetical protein